MAHDNYNGSVLGRILYKMKPDGETKFTIGRDKQEYVRGLKDAGVMHAGELYNMLCKSLSVEIEFFGQETDL